MSRELDALGRLMPASAEPHAAPAYTLLSFSFWPIAPEQRRLIRAFMLLLKDFPRAPVLPRKRKLDEASAPSTRWATNGSLKSSQNRTYTMLRRSSQSNAPRHRDGFGSAAHVLMYETRFYVAGLVYSHRGQKPQDVRETLLEESRGHLQGVARFRGVPWSRIKLLANAAKKAIDMALKDYKTAGPQLSDRQLGWMILLLQNGPYLDAKWGAEEHAVVRRFLRSVPEMDVDRGTVTIVALGYLEDPRDYDAAITQGLTEAGYIRQAVRRHKEEARTLRIGGHRFQEAIAETERVLTCAPDPFEEHSLQTDVQRAMHPSRASEPANSRFEHPRLWVPDETLGDEDRRAYQDKIDESLVTYATEAQEICQYMRMWLEDGEDYAAIVH